MASPTTVRFKQQWIESIQRERHDFEQVLELIDPFKNWETINNVPTITIAAALDDALDILYAGTEPELARKFLNRAWAQIERTEQDNKFAQVEQEPDYPLYRAEFLKYKYFTAGLLGMPRDDAWLYESAQQYMRWLEHRKPPAWHDQDQSYFLSAVSNFLIAGNAPKALALFGTHPGVHWIHPEGPLWQELSQAAAVGRPPGELLRQRLWQRFDVVRDPEYRPDYFSRVPEFRFAFGTIMWKYVEHAAEKEIDWHGVIELIAV